MAVTSRTVTVTTTAAAIDTEADGDNVTGTELILYNAGSQSVYIGGSNVTTANGVPIAATSHGPQKFFLRPGDRLYAIVAATTADLRVLETGV